MHPVLWVQPPERPSRGSVWKLTPISARGLVHGHDGLDEFTRRVGYCHSRVSRNPASACKTTFCLVREWNWKVGAAVLSGDLRTSVDPSPFGRQRMHERLRHRTWPQPSMKNSEEHPLSRGVAAEGSRGGSVSRRHNPPQGLTALSPPKRGFHCDFLTYITPRQAV